MSENSVEIPFKVELCRTSYSSATVVVEARSEEEAKNFAMDIAGDQNYSEYGADYEVETIREVTKEVTKATANYVLFGGIDTQDGQPMFWDNTSGWGDLAAATRFAEKETQKLSKARYNRDTEPQWVKIKEGE